MNPQTFRAQVNAQLRPLGVKIVAGRGYSYFVSLRTGDQIGESVMVYRQSDQSIAGWVNDAKDRIADYTRYGRKV